MPKENNCFAKHISTSLQCVASMMLLVFGGSALIFVIIIPFFSFLPCILLNLNLSSICLLFRPTLIYGQFSTQNIMIMLIFLKFVDMFEI
jgi:hypothetical protein